MDAAVIQHTRDAMAKEMAKTIPAHIHPSEDGLIVEILHEAWPRDQYWPLLDDIIAVHRERHRKSEMLAGAIFLLFMFPFGIAAICVASLMHGGLS